MLPFKKGPFIVATEVKVPIVPFIIHGAREVQGRHNFLVRPGTVQVEFLERAHPEIRTLTQRLDVMRWGHAMIRPRPGFVWGGARLRESQPFGSVHFANTDLSGLALFEEAQDHGLRAAEEVLAASGRRGESWR